MSMRPSPKLRPGGWDALVAAAILLLAAACAVTFWSRGGADGEALTAVVWIDGEETERLALGRETQERTYTGHGYTLQVLADREGVQVSQADCPTQDCVHTGVIRQAGQSIVCLPGRIVIQLERADGGSGSVDLVIG